MSEDCSKSTKGKLDDVGKKISEKGWPEMTEADASATFAAFTKYITEASSALATREITALEQLNTGLKTKVKMFEAENKAVKNELEVWRSQVKDKLTEIKTLQTENSTLESTILDMTAEAKQLQEQIRAYAAVSKEVVTLKALVVKLKTDNSALCADNETLRAANTVLLQNQASNDSDLDVDELTAKNRRLQAENARLQAFLASAVAKEEKMNQSNRSTYELNNQLMDENTKLNLQVREFDQKLDALQEELDLKNRKLKRLEQTANSATPVVPALTIAPTVSDTVPTLYAVDNASVGFANNVTQVAPATGPLSAEVDAKPSLQVMTNTAASQSSADIYTVSLQSSSAVMEHLAVEPAVVEPVMMEVEVAVHKPRWRDRYRQSVAPDAPETTLQAPQASPQAPQAPQASEVVETVNTVLTHVHDDLQEELSEDASAAGTVECEDEAARDDAMQTAEGIHVIHTYSGSGETADSANSCCSDVYDPSQASSDEEQQAVVRASSTFVRSVVVHPPPRPPDSSGLVLQDPLLVATAASALPPPLYPHNYEYYTQNPGTQEDDSNFYKVVVSNVPRCTKSGTIEYMARNCGSVISTQSLPSGTEFLLEFVKAKDAKHAVSQLDGYVLDGKPLQCRKYDESTPFAPPIMSAAIVQEPLSCTVYVRFDGGKEDVRREVERCGPVTSISYQRTHDWFVVDFDEPGSALLALQLLHNLLVDNKTMTCYHTREAAMNLPPAEPVTTNTRAMSTSTSTPVVVLSDPVLVENISKRAQKRAELAARNESNARRDRQNQLSGVGRGPPRAAQQSGAHRTITSTSDSAVRGNHRDGGRSGGAAVSTVSNRALKRSAADASLPDRPVAQPVDLAGANGIPQLSSKRK